MLRMCADFLIFLIRLDPLDPRHPRAIHLFQENKLCEL